jgi:hypothetical protein
MIYSVYEAKTEIVCTYTGKSDTGQQRHYTTAICHVASFVHDPNDTCLISPKCCPVDGVVNSKVVERAIR